MGNLLLAFILGAFAVMCVPLFLRGWKPKVIEFSAPPQVKRSTQVRVVGPTETLVSDVEPGFLKLEWQPEMQLRYPGAIELNRIYTTLRESMQMETLAQDKKAGGVQETIRLACDAPPVLIFAWYREQLTSQGWQPAEGDSLAVRPAMAAMPDATATTRRYVRNEEEFCVAIDDPSRVSESFESFWKNLDANLKDGNVQLEKILGDNPVLKEKLQHLPSLEGKTVFEIRYSKKN